MIRECDVLIIGSGPAGCTAAIYTVRAGFRTIILSGAAHGGQLVKTNDIENFPGFEQPVSGFEVMDIMHKQCKRLGVYFENEAVVKFDDGARPFAAHTSSGSQYNARAVVIASGSSASWLGIESEKKFIGKGVSSCATCDGFFYKGKDVCVVGGGNKAFEEALFLTRFCNKVYLIHRREGFRAHKVTVDKAKANSKIEFVLSSVIETVNGDERGVKSVTLAGTSGGGKREIALNGVFVAIGMIPQTEFLKDGAVKLLESGHVRIDANMRTSVEGVFAAGDCADKFYNQAVVAAGSGAKAGMEVINFLNDLS